MAFKITINGVVIEADTAREAMTLAQMVSPEREAAKARVQQPATRPAQLFGNVEPVPLRTAPTPSPWPEQIFSQYSTAGSDALRMNEAALAHKVLTTIAGAGAEGIPSSELQPVVGGDLLALGSKLRPVKRVLLQLGYPNLDDVYRSERIDNRSLWYPGPKLGEALQKVSELGGIKQ